MSAQLEDRLRDHFASRTTHLPNRGPGVPSTGPGLLNDVEPAKTGSRNLLVVAASTIVILIAVLVAASRGGSETTPELASGGGTDAPATSPTTEALPEQQLDASLLFAPTTGTEPAVFDYEITGRGTPEMSILTVTDDEVCTRVELADGEAASGCADALSVRTGLAYGLFGESTGGFTLVGVVPDEVDTVQLNGVDVEIVANTWKTRLDSAAPAELRVGNSRTGQFVVLPPAESVSDEGSGSPATTVASHEMVTTTVPTSGHTCPDGVECVLYEIRQGDYPILIAETFCVSLDELAEINGWGNDLASEWPAPNDTIRIPTFLNRTSCPDLTSATPLADGAVLVANANTVGGSAGSLTEQLQSAGYQTLMPVNSTLDRLAKSIIYANSDAQCLAEQLADVLAIDIIEPIPDRLPVDDPASAGDPAVVIALGDDFALQLAEPLQLPPTEINCTESDG